MEAEEYLALRKTLGSPKEVAEILGVSRSVVQKRETGKVGISHEAEVAIRHFCQHESPEQSAEAVGLSPEDLAQAEVIASLILEKIKEIPLAAPEPVYGELPPPPVTSEAEDWVTLGFTAKKHPTAYKEVKQAAKLLLSKQQAGSEEHDRISGAHERIYNKNFAVNDNES